MVLSQKQKELVEKIGIYFEEGMQPAPARILALLIVADQDSFSFNDIKEILNLSKSATSNGINFLLNLKKIEYYTKSGDRKRYFRWDPDNIINHFREGISKILALSILFDETYQLKKDQSSYNAQKISEISDLMNFLHLEMPGVIEKWESKRASKPSIL